MVKSLWIDKAMKKVDVILLCGGKGSRFQTITQDLVPKSLYKVNGKELIRYSIEPLDFNNVGRLIFAVDHHAEALKTWVNKQNFPCPVFFSYQTEPGVRGAVTAALAHVAADDFAVCNTDEIRIGMSFNHALAAHQGNDGLATMVTAPSSHLFYHRHITTDAQGHITDTVLNDPAYQHDTATVRNVNIGFIFFRKTVVDWLDDTRGTDGSSVIDPLVEHGHMYAVHDPNIHYFNVGTRDELTDAMAYLQLQNARQLTR